MKGLYSVGLTTAKIRTMYHMKGGCSLTFHNTPPLVAKPMSLSTQGKLWHNAKKEPDRARHFAMEPSNPDNLKTTRKHSRALLQLFRTWSWSKEDYTTKQLTKYTNIIILSSSVIVVVYISICMVYDGYYITRTYNPFYIKTPQKLMR